METSITQVKLVQLLSPGRFIFDILFLSLILTFFYNELSFPTPYVELGIGCLIAAIAVVVFSYFPFSMTYATILSLSTHLLLFAFQGSFLMYLFLSLYSIWRLLERFGKVQYESIRETSFLLKFSLAYVFLCLYLPFFGLLEELNIATTLFFMAILIALANRFIVQWLRSKELNETPFWKIAVFISAFIVIGSSIFFMMLRLSIYIRLVIEFILLKVLGVVLTPLGGLFDGLINYLLSLIERNGEVPSPVIPGESDLEEPAQEQPSFEQIIDFPWWIVATAVFILVFLIILIKLFRNKPEFDVEVNQQFETSRESISNDPSVKNVGDTRYDYSMDSHIVREAYRDFEQSAGDADLARHLDETVKEWFKRMTWQVTNRFYDIYDEVRYGGETIPESDGIWFMNELKKLKENYFDKDV